MTAAAKGDLGLLERTLGGEYGEVTDEDVKEALLRSACHGNKACLSRLLAHGADPNCEDMDGDTPLMIASSNDHVDVVKLLIESGSDVDLRSERNRTALHMAVWNQRSRITKLLLRAGCDTDVRDRYGDTPLMLCARRGYVEILKILIMCGSDLNKKSHENDTALHYAARHGHLSCIQLLLAQLPQIDIEATTIWGFTPLALAAMNGHPDVVLTLISAGANIMARDRSEKTVLHYAVKKDLGGVVEWLLELGADVNGLDSDGNSPLYEALNGGRIAMVKLLLQFGADVKVVGRATLNRQYCWCCPLEIAVYTGDLSACKMLHAVGCDFSQFLKELDLSLIPSKEVRAWAESILAEPRSLKDASRIVIRNAMGIHVKEMTQRLPLPYLIRTYVACCDDDEFEG